MNVKRNEKTNTRIATILCIICLIIFGILVAYVQEGRKDLMQQNSEYLSVIEEYSSKYAELESQANTYKSQIKSYKAQIKDYKTQIEEYKEQLETTTEPVTTQSLATIKTNIINGATNSVFSLSDYERRIVECIVMGEAGGESYEGQVLVAQCIFNACNKDGLQPSDVLNKYQYSGWHNNPSQTVKNAVSAVFDEGYKATNEYILYFYAPKHCTSEWHESQKFVCEIGGHRFFAQW